MIKNTGRLHNSVNKQELLSQSGHAVVRVTEYFVTWLKVI